jgi:hypothetical protein
MTFKFKINNINLNKLFAKKFQRFKIFRKKDQNGHFISQIQQNSLFPLYI